jgi:predicted transcriptional regulator
MRMKDKEGMELLVYFDHLHKATVGKIVYRSIEQSRLNSIINMVHITMDLSNSDWENYCTTNEDSIDWVKPLNNIL